MHGNVWEWCQDGYGEYMLQKKPAKNPAEPKTGAYRVFRGGSWMNDPWYCRSAYRFRDFPDFHYRLIGFRTSV